MFKKLLTQIKRKIGSKVRKGSYDAQGNYYSPQDDDKLAARQTAMQAVRTANPRNIKSRETPNVAGKDIVYRGVENESPFAKLLGAIKSKANLKASLPQVQGSTTTYSERFTTPTPTPTRAVPTPTPTPDLREWDNFKGYIAREAQRKGYHPGIIVAQKALESARGQSAFARNRNNYGGIGAYDSNPNNAFSYESPEAYLNAYFKLIENRYPKAYEVRNNPKAYARELKRGGYASDPEYVNKLLGMPEFREFR